MNNSNQNTNRGLLDQSRNNTNSQFGGFNGQAGANYSQASGQDQQLRNQIQGRYSDPSNFMASGTMPNSSGWFNLPGSQNNGGFGSSSGYGGSGGGSSIPGLDPNSVAMAGADFSAPKAGYQGMSDTGGAGQYAAPQSYYTSAMNNGIGTAAANDIRYRDTAAVPSFYNALKNNLQTQSNVQGGYSPGFNSQMQSLARTEGGQAYDASRQAEGDIANLNMQQSNAGAAGLTGIAGAINSNKLAGLSGLTGIGNSELGASEFNANNANQRYNTNLGAQMNLADMYNRNALASAGGLQSLYSSAPGATGQSGNLALGGISGQANADNTNLGIRSSIYNNSLLGLVPGLVGAGAGAMTGFGNMAKSFGWT